MRYRSMPSYHPLPVVVLLLAMAICLLLLPRVVFAAETDSLPRYTLTPKQVGEAVAVEIQEAEIAPLVEASVDVEDPHTVYGADEPMQVTVSGLQADKKNKRWSANVIFKNGDKVITAMPMQGKFQAIVVLPALSKTLAAGEVIVADNVVMKRFPAQYARTDILTDASSLIGQAVKRTVSADRPLRTHEIAAPIVAKKNAVMQLSYDSGAIHISASGQLLADASVGDVVEVRNLNSNQVVRAVIRDGKTASVLPFVQTSALGDSHAEIN